jgi:hypothetical protein
MSTINAAGTLYIRDIGSIEYSTDNINWNVVGPWPVTINNLDAPSSIELNIVFNTQINITSNDQYFIINAFDFILFGSLSLNPNGSRNQINILNTANNYPGLIQSGTSSNPSGASRLIISNIYVNVIGATLAIGAGWICQEYIGGGGNTYIINCATNGDISDNGGGLVGQYSGIFGGRMELKGCSSSGLIGQGGGGLLGQRTCDSGGNLYIEQCFSSGYISLGGGGLIGQYSGGSGFMDIKTSFSKGEISANAGGIIGQYPGISGSIFISRCFSEGNIGTNSGGIVGPNSVGTNIIQVTNSYSIGQIDTQAGGIFGFDYDPGNCRAQNCYTSGNSLLVTGGIFSNSTDDNPIGSSNNFSEANNGNSGQWFDSNAILYLQAIGTSWLSPSINTPYILLNFRASPYVLNNINRPTIGVFLFVQTYSNTVQAGDSTSVAINNSNKLFNIVSGGDVTITIDSLTGEITTTVSTIPGIYNLIIYTTTDYTTTTYILTVTAAPTPPTPAGGAGAETTIPPCCEANICNKNPQESSYSCETIAIKKSGKTINSGVANFYNGVASGARTAYSQPIFKSYYDYMQYLQGKTR